VANAALDRRRGAEHVADRLAQRLGAVEHAEHALGAVEATIDEVGEQRGGHRGVLGGALPEPERELLALGGDAERHHVGAALELDAVEHQHRQAHVIEASSHERGQGLGRAGHEGARDRRLRGRARSILDLGADRLLGAGEAPRGYDRQHALEHGGAQRIARGEVREGLERELALLVGASHPRAADRHAAGPEGDRGALVAVSLGAASGIVAALRSDHLLDLGLHQLVKDAEPDTDREGHEALLRRSGELAKRLPDPFGQLLEALLLGDGRVHRYGPHRGGSSSSRGLGRARQAPSGAGRGGRTAAFKFYGLRDVLHRRPDVREGRVTSGRYWSVWVKISQSNEFYGKRALLAVGPPRSHR
jgi:hypothetical protein